MRDDLSRKKPNLVSTALNRRIRRRQRRRRHHNKGSTGDRQSKGFSVSPSTTPSSCRQPVTYLFFVVRDSLPSALQPEAETTYSASVPGSSMGAHVDTKEEGGGPRDLIHHRGVSIEQPNVLIQRLHVRRNVRSRQVLLDACNAVQTHEVLGYYRPGSPGSGLDVTDLWDLARTDARPNGQATAYGRRFCCCSLILPYSYSVHSVPDRPAKISYSRLEASTEVRKYGSTEVRRYGGTEVQMYGGTFETVM